MNLIQRALFERMIDGDPQIRELFEDYVRKMGHKDEEALQIVESIIADGKKILNEDMDLASMAKMDKRNVL